MNQTYLKPLLAFVAGIALAGGGLYFFNHKDQPAAQVAAVTPASAPQAEPAATPAVQTPPPAEPAPAAVEPPAPAKPKPTPVKTKRPARREEPAPAAPAPKPSADDDNAIAQNTPPPVDAPKQDAAPPPPPEPPKPKTVTLDSGTLLQVRLIDALSTERNATGDRFNASLDAPLVVDGVVIAERGAKVQGVVTKSEKAGKVKGLSELALQLTEIHTSDGQTVKLDTTPWQKEGETSKKGDAAKVGIGAGVGAALGAIFGGGKGAAIGAAAGGGAGTAGVLMTRGKPAEVPSETRLTFRLQTPVTVTEKLNSGKSDSARYNY